MLKKLMNKSEAITHGVLIDSVAGTNLRVLPQQLMRNVIDVKDLALTKSERKCWKQSSFDFVVIDSESQPQFAVDFDGPSHKRSKRMQADLRKLSICAKSHLPIAKIDDDYLSSQENISTLEFMIQRFWHWQQESAQMNEEIKSTVDLLQRMGKSEEEIHDAVMDTEMSFNFAHYYPGYEAVVERLQVEHYLLPTYLIQGDLGRSSSYHLLSSISNTDADGYLVGLSCYEVEGNVINKKQRKKIKWGNVEATFRIRWVYEKELEAEDYMNIFGKSAMETNEEFRKEYGNSPIKCVTSLHVDLPGLSFPDLVSMISSYKCLRLIEEKCIDLRKEGWRFEQSLDSSGLQKKSKNPMNQTGLLS